MTLGGPGCRLQTCSCLAAEWFNSTFRADGNRKDSLLEAEEMRSGTCVCPWLACERTVGRVGLFEGNKRAGPRRINLVHVSSGF
ncbi:hypothetical protein SRHO_G00202410 [Serrasalmus rhombeus]